MPSFTVPTISALQGPASLDELQFSYVVGTQGGAATLPVVATQLAMKIGQDSSSAYQATASADGMTVTLPN